MCLIKPIIVLKILHSWNALSCFVIHSLKSISFLALILFYFHRQTLYLFSSVFYCQAFLDLRLLFCFKHFFAFVFSSVLFWVISPVTVSIFRLYAKIRLYSSAFLIADILLQTRYENSRVNFLPFALSPLNVLLLSCKSLHWNLIFWLMRLLSLFMVFGQVP